MLRIVLVPELELDRTGIMMMNARVKETKSVVVELVKA